MNESDQHYLDNLREARRVQEKVDRIVGMVAVVIIALLLVGFFWIRVSQAHNWAMGDYEWVMKNQETRSCCGPEDCMPVDDLAISQKNGKWFVNGKQVDRVYPSQAKDAQHHVCYYPGVSGLTDRPRCLFLPSMF